MTCWKCNKKLTEEDKEAVSVFGKKEKVCNACYKEWLAYQNKLKYLNR